MKPQRIRLRRTPGFNLQRESRELNGLEAVSCARPGKWGNPYVVGTIDEVTGKVIDQEKAVRLHRSMVSQTAFPEFRAVMRKELRGKNLACWCREGQPCHCDVLLEISNS